MATLLELQTQGVLLKADPVLGAREQEVRVLYASTRLTGWIQGTLPSLGSTWDIELSPQEQLDAFLAVYARGDALTFGQAFRPLVHISDGIWELKTADLRLFGWFYKKDCFIGHAANITETIKQHNLYHGYAGEVARFRDLLLLDEPKFVPGDDPNDVVSDWDYP